MPRGRDARLVRLALESMRVDATKGLDDATLSAWRIACLIVRDGMKAAGFDPDCAAALRSRNSGTEPVLSAPATRRDEPGSRGPDQPSAAADDDGLAGLFTTRIGEVAHRFRDGRSPDLASASLAELLAWVLHRRGA